MNPKERIERTKLVAILRGVRDEVLSDMVRGLRDGGIDCVECALDHADESAVKRSLRQIERLRGLYPDIAVGAGTVMSAKEVRLTVSAGAQYIISPDAKDAVIDEAKLEGVLSIPGALTPGEVARAYERGADIIKLFPAGEFGVSYFMALRSPLKHIPMGAVGGIDERNAAEYISAGAVFLGVGGSLTKPAENGRVYETLRARAQALVKAVK